MISNCTTKAIVIKDVWYWYKNTHIDLWNRIKSLEIKPLNCTKYMVNYYLTRETRIFNGGKNSFFSKWCWETVYSHAKE